jgi:predicted Zn-dependent protease
MGKGEAMTAAQGSTERTVIPRWRAWRTTEQAKELLPLNTPDADTTHAAEQSLAQHVADYKQNRGLHMACDLVNTAVVLGLQDEYTVDAARFVSEHPKASTAAKLVAAHLLNPGKNRPGPEAAAHNVSHTQYRESIARLKSITINEPRNAVRWVDLARAYTALGVSSAATRAMKVALGTGIPNRFVLRAAARFEIHRNNNDYASRILNAHPGKLEDPWVLAAEIATSTLNETTSRHMKLAKKILEVRDLDPRHLSELASAVATVEWNNGKTKPARRLMAFALEHPTDNSLAQGEWFVAKGFDLGEIEDALLSAPLGFEARASHARRNEDWEEAVENGLLWIADQPFSYDAAVFTSYAASMGAEDYEKGEQAATLGLITNPDSPMLRNNRAFALINLGNLEEASKELDHIKMTELSRRKNAIVTATQGLLRYREGLIEEGRTLYVSAIESLAHQGFSVEAAMASALNAREEMRAQTEYVPAAIARAERNTRNGGHEARSFYGRIMTPNSSVDAGSSRPMQ